jgi:hypothetical protein
VDDVHVPPRAIFLTGRNFVGIVQGVLISHSDARAFPKLNRQKSEGPKNPTPASDEAAARVGARSAGTNSSVLIVGRLLFVWDLESHH